MKILCEKLATFYSNRVGNVVMSFEGKLFYEV